MKKILIAVIAAAVIVLGYWALVKKPKQQAQTPPPGKSTQPGKSSEPAPQFTYAEPAKAPEGFPAFIPLEKGAKITDNFNAVAPDGKKTSVREFVSAVSMDANYTLYKKFLKDNGFAAETDISQADQKIISGTKDGYRLRVRIYTVNKEVRVTLNYVQM